MILQLIRVDVAFLVMGAQLKLSWYSSKHCAQRYVDETARPCLGVFYRTKRKVNAQSTYLSVGCSISLRRLDAFFQRRKLFRCHTCSAREAEPVPAPALPTRRWAKVVQAALMRVALQNALVIIAAPTYSTRVLRARPARVRLPRSNATASRRLVELRVSLGQRVKHLPLNITSRMVHVGVSHRLPRVRGAPPRRHVPGCFVPVAFRRHHLKVVPRRERTPGHRRSGVRQRRVGRPS